MTPNPKALTRTAAVSTEQLIHTGRCVLYAIVPETTGGETVTLRDDDATGGANVKFAGLIPAPGKEWEGALFASGLTLQLSIGTERYNVIWESL